MNAEHELLASAYLDGELTDEERRIAEADPAVMAEVEQLRALQTELVDVEPPTDAARERALAAAMDAFSEIHTAPITHTAPLTSPAVEISRRRDPMRWLGIAAAVLVIGLLGVVVAAGLGRGDDDDASESADEPIEVAEAPADEPAEESAATGGADAPLVADESETADRLTEGTAEVADDDMSIAEEPAFEPEEAAEEPAEEPAQGDAEAGDDTVVTAPAAIELRDPEEYLDGYPMSLPEELAWVGRHLADLIERGELPPTPNHSCPFPDVLARGVLVDDETPVDVYIAVTPDTRTVLAIDQELCRVLLETDLIP